MAAYTWVGTTSDWGTGSNWSPAAPAGGPGVGDTVTFNNAANCTTGTTARNCLTLTTTGYTGTLTIGASTAGTLTVAGNVTLGSTVGHISGLANIIVSANTATIDVATGVTVPNLLFSASVTQTITLSRTTTITNLSKIGSNPTTVTAASGVLLNVDNGTIGNSWAGTLIAAANVTLTIVGSTSVSSSIAFTGALNLTSGSTLSLNGGLSFIGNSTFTCNLGTFTPNLQTVSLPSGTITVNMGTNSFYNLSFTGGTNTTVTMQSNINVTNNFTMTGSTAFNGAFDITIGGNCSGGTVSNSTSGRKITVTALSTGTATLTTFSLNNINLEINCSNRNVVFASSTTYTNCTINYLATNSGTFTTTTHILNYNATSINMNGSTNSWGTLQNTGGVTRIVTLLSNVYFQTIGTTSSGDNLNGAGFSLYVGGNVGPMNNTTGTATLRFIGSSNATWTVNAGTTISLFGIAFERTGGTLNIPNNFIYTGTGGITWTSGAINHTATLTLGTTILNTSSVGMSWNSLTINAGATLTINQPLSILNNLTLNGSATFAGTAGWDCANLVSTAAGTFTVTLQQAVTYRTRLQAFITGGTSTARTTMTSSSGTVRAIWTLDQGASQSLIYVNGTRIDSSQGQTVWSFGGVLTDTINWNPGSPPGTLAYTFVN
jgi:hypothetical protein